MKLASASLEAHDFIVETWDALRIQQNVRQFTDQPVPDEVNRLARIVCGSPSAHH
jgi:hypothetical protein